MLFQQNHTYELRLWKTKESEVADKLTLFECMVNIQQSQVIAVYVRKPLLRFIRLFLDLRRAHEALWD